MIRLSPSIKLALIATLFLSSPSFASWIVHQERNGDQVRMTSVERSTLIAGKNPKLLRALPKFLREDAPASAIYEEVLYSDPTLPSAARALADAAPSLSARFDDTEVRTLVSQGPKENRINLTILGDGYTLAEKNKFFADAERIKNELFVGQTFASYLPLFNVYAVFVPSRDSGITDGNNRKDTAFNLYRDPPGSKRAIMPGNEEALEAAIQLAPATDYPIVLANDDFYGGLGGRFAISTRSVESGIVVLRHELGHNFGQVGEEYDGGYVYSGANSSTSRESSWPQWLTDSQARVFDSLFLSGEYVWQNLAQKDYTADFTFPQATSEGGYQFEVIISSVGWKAPGDVAVEFDGQTVNLEGRWTADRSFFTFHLDQSPAPGKHRLTVREAKHDGTAHILAFAELYAQPASLDFSRDIYAAYATFNSNGRMAGYRPTHKGCLMRDMLNPNFCSVDKENMWIRFLNRVSLIDNATYDTKTKTVTLLTPELLGLDIHWYQVSAAGSEAELTPLAGKNSWVNDGIATGTVKAKVSFRTAEVRKSSAGLSAERTVQLK